MPAAGRRKKLADVTPESYDGWDAFATRHGTTVTALAEVFGIWFSARDVPLEQLNPALRRLVVQAQELSRQRLRRPQD